MAHYAFLDTDNIVTEVIVGCDEDDTSHGVSGWEEWYSGFRKQRCLQTSYNTLGGVHLLGGTPFRGNYAGIGYTYDEALDAFIPPRPEQGQWVLDENTYLWKEAINETE